MGWFILPAVPLPSFPPKVAVSISFPTGIECCALAVPAAALLSPRPAGTTVIPGSSAGALVNRLLYRACSEVVLSPLVNRDDRRAPVCPVLRPVLMPPTYPAVLPPPAVPPVVARACRGGDPFSTAGKGMFMGNAEDDDEADPPPNSDDRG